MTTETAPALPGAAALKARLTGGNGLIGGGVIGVVLLEDRGLTQLFGHAVRDAAAEHRAWLVAQPCDDQICVVTDDAHDVKRLAAFFDRAMDSPEVALLHEEPHLALGGTTWNATRRSTNGVILSRVALASYATALLKARAFIAKAATEGRWAAGWPGDLPGPNELDEALSGSGQAERRGRVRVARFESAGRAQEFGRALRADRSARGFVAAPVVEEVVNVAPREFPVRPYLRTRKLWTLEDAHAGSGDWGRENFGDRAFAAIIASRLPHAAYAEAFLNACIA